MEREPISGRTGRIIAWGGVVLGAVAVLGLIYAPGVLLLWIVLLVFAVASIPQALFARRLYERRSRDPHRQDRSERGR